MVALQLIRSGVNTRTRVTYVQLTPRLADATSVADMAFAMTAFAVFLLLMAVGSFDSFWAIFLKLHWCWFFQATLEWSGRRRSSNWRVFCLTAILLNNFRYDQFAEHILI